MTLTQAIGQRILQLKNLEDLTLNDLATKAQVPLSSIKNLIYNKTNHPNTYLIYQICKYLNITLSDFFDSKIFKKVS